MTSRILGIDFGTVRLGLALSDATKLIASPAGIITAEKRSELTAQKVVEKIRELEETYGSTIEKVVIGMPKRFSGKHGMMGDEVQHFITLLQQHITIPIIPWDERLTTLQAERAMRESNMSRKKRSKIIDTISAVVILQSYLDSIQQEK